MSWSPKRRLRRPTGRPDSMTFGLAMRGSQEGQADREKGWNGKGQYVELATGIGYVRGGRERQT